MIEMFSFLFVAVRVIAVLSVLIFIHELGHFFVARKFGVKVEEFGFGYPPRIWGKKIKDVVYSINWLPFGGFVRLYGEDYLERDKSMGGKALCNKPPGVRAAVALAGVLNNFLLGILCFSIVYSFIGIPTQTNKAIVSAVSIDSPAEAVGIGLDEQIVSVDGLPVQSADDFVSYTKDKRGRQITIETLKDNDKKEYQLIPRMEFPQGEGAIGVAISSTEMKFYPAWQMPFRGAVVGVKEAVGWGLMIIDGLVLFFRGIISGVVPEVAGPVGIVEIASGVVTQGWILTLQFIGVLSINLAILNLLPFPALDGGRLAFIGFELITGKRVKSQIEQYIHMAGMIILISFMLFVTYKDITRLVVENSFLSGIITSLRQINF